MQDQHSILGLDPRFEVKERSRVVRFGTRVVRFVTRFKAKDGENTISRFGVGFEVNAGGRSIRLEPGFEMGMEIYRRLRLSHNASC